MPRIPMPMGSPWEIREKIMRSLSRKDAGKFKWTKFSRRRYLRELRISGMMDLSIYPDCVMNYDRPTNHPDPPPDPPRIEIFILPGIPF